MSNQLGQPTLIFLYQLLTNQTLSVGADDFDATATTVLAVKAELEQAISDQTVVTENHEPIDWPGRKEGKPCP